MTGWDRTRMVPFLDAPGMIWGISAQRRGNHLRRPLERRMAHETDSDRLRVFGHDDVAEPLRVKDHLGIMPQEADPFEYLTTHQHLRIFGKLRGLSAVAARRRADELVE